MDDFHPDLERAEKMSRSVATKGRAPMARAALRLAGAIGGRNVPKATGATGQKIWLFRPKAPSPAPRPALLWMYGGGMVIGSPILEQKLCQKIADRFGALVAAPVYRLAPKDPYPAALDDLAAALEWLAAQPEVDPTRIAVGGDSGGAGLAAALAIRARDAGGPAICYQVLHEPMLDEATRRRTLDPEDYRMWGPEVNAWAWAGYLANVKGDVPPTASPARLTDATGLPPAFIGVGTRDLFYDEDRAYAEVLRQAGVAVTFTEVPGGYHGFPASEPNAPVSKRYIEGMLDALGAAWGMSAT